MRRIKEIIQKFEQSLSNILLSILQLDNIISYIDYRVIISSLICGIIIIAVFLKFYRDAVSYSYIEEVPSLDLDSYDQIFLSEGYEVNHEETSKCPYCNETLHQTSIFCPECGSRLKIIKIVYSN